MREPPKCFTAETSTPPSLPTVAKLLFFTRLVPRGGREQGGGGGGGRGPPQRFKRHRVSSQREEEAARDRGVTERVKGSPLTLTPPPHPPAAAAAAAAVLSLDQSRSLRSFNGETRPLPKIVRPHNTTTSTTRKSPREKSNGEINAQQCEALYLRLIQTYT